jgi:hypothetical protein
MPPRTCLAPWPTALVLGVIVLASGCTTVTPSQRQQLSRPEMTPATDAVEEVWHTHVEAAREAGFGGHGAAGGGCGCG